MFDDPCEKCGHRRKRTMMSTNPEYRGQSLGDMWRDGEPWQQRLMRLAVCMVIFMVLTFVVVPNI